MGERCTGGKREAAVVLYGRNCEADPLSEGKSYWEKDKENFSSDSICVVDHGWCELASSSAPHRSQTTAKLLDSSIANSRKKKHTL